MRQSDLSFRVRKTWVLGLTSILFIASFKSSYAAPSASPVAKLTNPQCTHENIAMLRERHECMTSVGVKGCFLALAGPAAVVVGGALAVAAGEAGDRKKGGQFDLNERMADHGMRQRELDRQIKEAEDKFERKLVKLEKVQEDLTAAEAKRPGKKHKNLVNQVNGATIELEKASQALGRLRDSKMAYEQKYFVDNPHSKEGSRLQNALFDLSKALGELGDVDMKRAGAAAEVAKMTNRVNALRADVEDAHKEYAKGKQNISRRKRFVVGGLAGGILAAAGNAFQIMGSAPEQIPPQCKMEKHSALAKAVALDEKCQPEITQAGLIRLSLLKQAELAQLCTDHPELATTLSRFQEQTTQVIKSISPKISNIKCKEGGGAIFTSTIDGKPYTTKLTSNNGLWTLKSSFKPATDSPSKSGDSPENPLEMFTIRFDQILQGGVVASANPQFKLYDSGAMTTAAFLRDYEDGGFQAPALDAAENLNAPEGKGYKLVSSVAQQFLASKISIPLIQDRCPQGQEGAVRNSAPTQGQPIPASTK